MLSTFSKVFEKLLFEQINDHMQSKFSKHLTGFHKNYGTQNALLVITEKYETISNKKLGCSFHAFVKTLWYSRRTSIEKLSVYVFDNNSLSFFQSYLTYRFKTFKIENHFSNSCEITTDVPQGSILGSLLFNNFINDIFLFVEISNVCNYADDNNLFAFGETIRKLQNDFLISDEWFFNNFLVLILTNVILLWLLKHLILHLTLNVKKSQSRSCFRKTFSCHYR